MNPIEQKLKIKLSRLKMSDTIFISKEQLAELNKNGDLEIVTYWNGEVFNVHNIEVKK